MSEEFVNARNLRIALLKKYYPVDEENKIVTFKLYYEQASDLLDYSIGEEGKEPFKEDFLDKIASLFSNLPRDYKAKVILEIKNYDVYDEATIMEKFNDFLKLSSYNSRFNSKKNGFLSAISAIVGCLLLALDGVLMSLNILNDDSGILPYVLNQSLIIASWVFIWQAVSNLFLTSDSRSKTVNLVFNRLKEFSVARKGEVKLSKDIKQLSTDCRVDSSFSWVKRQALAVLSTLLFFEGLLTLIVSTIKIVAVLEGKLPAALSNYFDFAYGIILIISASLALTCFTNRYIKKTIFAAAFILTLLYSILYLVYITTNEAGISNFVNVIFSLALLIFVYVLCLFWDHFKPKKAKKKPSKKQ